MDVVNHSTTMKESVNSMLDAEKDSITKLKDSELQESEISNKSESQETSTPATNETDVGLTNKETNEEDDKENEWLDILGSGQLKKKVLRKAENSFRAQRSNIVEINIEGKLPDDTIIDKQANLTLQVGDAEHIQALDIALTLMEVGELALLEVGPRFAYGSKGRDPDVPPNATILYTVELLSAEPEPDIEELPAAKRKQIGCSKRERGNYWYTRGEHTLAIQCYRRALNFLDDVEGGVILPSNDSNKTGHDDEVLHELLEERLKVYNNLAAAQMKIKAFDTALKSVDNVLICQPNNVKALYRKGKILSEKGENSQGVTFLRQAIRLEPENGMIRQELVQMLSLHREDTKHERNLYKKMLGQDKGPEDSSPKNNRFQFPWSILFGTLAAVVAGVVAYRYKFI